MLVCNTLIHEFKSRLRLSRNPKINDFGFLFILPKIAVGKTIRDGILLMGADVCGKSGQERENGIQIE